MTSLLLEIRQALRGLVRTPGLTLVAGCVLLLKISLVASWLPARRAARVDPMVVLRLE